MQETQVQPLGWEDPLEEKMATHSSIHAWRIPWIEEPLFFSRSKPFLEKFPAPHSCLSVNFSLERNLVLATQGEGIGQVIEMKAGGE